MPNPIIRIKRGSGSPVSLQVGEVAFDSTNKSFFIGTAEGVLPIAGEHIFAKKTFVSDAVAAEASLRSAADSTLTTNLNNEISRATAAEGVIAANLAQEIIDRAAAISSEASARSSADTTLDGKITTEKGRIDAILSASQADKDSFAEIVSLINSVDATNDTAFAGYVTSNNAALAVVALIEQLTGISNEITYFDSGHFGAYPLDLVPGSVTGGAIDWGRAGVTAGSRALANRAK
jgi:hypothetical protein